MLFHPNDAKKYVQGLSLVDDALLASLNDQESRARIVCNADLLLKYFTLRFFDTNTTVLLKVLDVLDHLLTVLETENYALKDYEAALFLPFFIGKMIGDSKDAIRTRVRTLLRRFYPVFPSSKVFLYLLEGLKSKNARTRAECLDEMASLVERQGISVCNAPKVFPVIARQISDRESAVRSNAINVLVQAHYHVGAEGVSKYVGVLPAKDRALLDERIKRAPPSSSMTNSSVYGTIGARVNEEKSDMGEKVAVSSTVSSVSGDKVSLSSDNDTDSASNTAHIPSDSSIPTVPTTTSTIPSAPMTPQKKGEFSLEFDAPAVAPDALVIPELKNIPDLSIVAETPMLPSRKRELTGTGHVTTSANAVSSFSAATLIAHINSSEPTKWYEKGKKSV